MYVVIFRANIGKLDEEYSSFAKQLRQLALEHYHCLEFHACTEGSQEVALSYWRSLQDIAAWRDDVQHKIAQHQAVGRWYQSCSVEIAEIVRQYQRSHQS